MNGMTLAEIRDECVTEGKVLRVKRRPGIGTHAEIRPTQTPRQTPEI